MSGYAATEAFPGVVISGSSASGTLLVDSSSLIDFDRLNSLDTLLDANRQILITKEVYKETVQDALRSTDPAVVASASRIDSWIQLHSNSVLVQNGDPNRPPITTGDPGDSSILADAAYLGAHGTNVAIVADDNDLFNLGTVPGAQFPVLTINYFLNSLLIGGAITPSDYFGLTTAGTIKGLNQDAFPLDTSSLFDPKQDYGIFDSNGVLRGNYHYTPVGSSSITYDGQTILFAPYEKAGIQNGVPFKTSDASDDATQLGYLDSPERSEYTALFTSFLTKASLSYSDAGPSPSDQGITLVAPNGNVNVDITGGADPQQNTAADGTNLLAGGTGNDQIQVSGGINFLAGGDGNDTFVLGSAGTDWIEGDAGRDVANYSLDPLGGLTATVAATNGRTGGDQIVDVTGNGVNDQINSIEQINLFGQNNTAVVKVVNDHQSIVSDVALDLGATLYSSNDAIDFSQYTGSVGLGDRKSSDGVKGAELFLDKNFTNTSHYSFQNFNTLNLGAGDDTVKLTQADDPYLHVINTGAGDNTISSDNINVTINLQGTNDTVLHAGKGSVINIGQNTHATIYMSDDVLIDGLKPTDVVYDTNGNQLHGAMGSPNTEAQWIYSYDGIGYALNALGQLGIKDLFGNITYLANYVGGPAVSYAGQMAGIFVGTISTWVWSLAGSTVPLSSIPDQTFKAANDFLFTMGLKPIFNADPLVLDLNGDGFNLTAVSPASPMLDMNVDGFKIDTGWVGSQDGLLVYDKNGNGVIDNASEIFGGGTGVDGFAALSAYDSNGDGKIDASDTIFGSLQVWRDINGDGVMNPGELQSLTDAGITSISLNATAQTGVTVNGNIVQSTSTFTRSDGSTGAIGDIQFNTDPFHSQFDGDQTISADAAAMPDLKGYGTLADLRVAMTLTPSLISTITADLPNLDLTTLDLATLRQAVMPILSAWAAASPERAADDTWHSVTPSARPGIAILTTDDGRRIVPRFPANDNVALRRALAL